jgi:hypothetical protein
MSELTIQENFLGSARFFSKYERKIWDLCLDFKNRYHQTDFSHTFIAITVGCTRRHVIRVLNKFRENGWLISVKKCFRPCVYFVRDELDKFSFKSMGNAIFQKAQSTVRNVTQHVTLLGKTTITSLKKGFNSTKRRESLLEKEKREFLQSMGLNGHTSPGMQFSDLSQEQQEKWLSRFGNETIKEALKDCDRFTKVYGNTIKYFGLYLWDACYRVRNNK